MAVRVRGKQFPHTPHRTYLIEDYDLAVEEE
jgi:hypothetical protein